MNLTCSIDQFFECFDGLRSSQANSGTSGLWNWTYSVLSAINVASNLASGSGHMLTGILPKMSFCEAYFHLQDMKFSAIMHDVLYLSTTIWIYAVSE